MDANAYSAGMVAGAAGADDYYSDYLKYKRAFEEMKAARDILQERCNRLYQTARTLTVALQQVAPQHPLADRGNVNAIFRGKKTPEDFNITLPGSSNS